MVKRTTVKWTDSSQQGLIKCYNYNGRLTMLAHGRGADDLSRGRRRGLVGVLREVVADELDTALRHVGHHTGSCNNHKSILHYSR